MEYAITSGRPQLGLRIPIHYGAGKVSPVSSPYVPPDAKGFTGIFEKAPNFILELNSTMRMGGMGHSMEGMGSMENMMTSMMRWTINGASYPETEPLFVKLGSVVKIRFVNNDVLTMHLHGTFFMIVSENGVKPARETWKDTVNVPVGRFVDIAFVMHNPGACMLHCHIIDHEDGGMMTMVMAE